MPIFIKHGSPAAPLGISNDVGNSRMSFQNSQLQNVQRQQAIQQQQFQEQLRQRQAEEDQQRQQRDFENQLRANQFNETVRRNDQQIGLGYDKLDQQFMMHKQRIESQIGRQLTQIEAQQLRANLNNQATMERTQAGIAGRAIEGAENRGHDQTMLAQKQGYDATQNEYDRNVDYAQIDAANKRATERIAYLRSQAKDPNWHRQMDYLEDKVNQARAKYLQASSNPRTRPQDRAALGSILNMAEREREDFINRSQQNIPQPPAPPAAPQFGQPMGPPAPMGPQSQVRPEDIEFTAQKYGMTPQQVLQQLGLA